MMLKLNISAKGMVFQKVLFAVGVGLIILLLNPVAYSQKNEIDFFDMPFSVDYEKTIAQKINGGIDEFLTTYTSDIVAERDAFWNRKFESVQAYNTSIGPNRGHLREILGIQKDSREVGLVVQGLGLGEQTIIAENDKCRIYQVEWSVLDGLNSEGLLLVPKGGVKASAIVLPDASETPEMYAGIEPGPDIALQLAEQGTLVLIPALIDRMTHYSGGDNLIPTRPWMSPEGKAEKWTNETHREWIWRQGYVMGKHIVGMEIQKVLAAVDWLEEVTETGQIKTGVMGYGEGGLIAFYAAALDTRIDATWVSGYFGPRENIWAEPVYRNIWGLLREFGDAEIASMIAPRSLIIEAAPAPRVKEPLVPQNGQRNDALPGVINTSSVKEVKNEVDRVQRFYPEDSQVQPDITMVLSVRKHGSEKALNYFLGKLGINAGPRPDGSLRTYTLPDAGIRHKRVFDNMQEYIQDMIPNAAQTRYSFLKGDYSSPESWDRDMEPYRKQFYNEMVGKIDKKLLPANPKIRQVYDEPGWIGYEVVLDVWSGVHSWGILAVPKNLVSGEKRPAIVLQHGIRGLPSTSIRVDSYHRVLPALVNRGFVVFAPYNPYQFNIRKAHAVRANAFSVIIPHYKQILNFLQSHESVDSSRIALYGKSWGGRTALRVPIVLDGFKVSVCNAYFNDWLNKVVSNKYANSYFYENSLGIYNWNMGNTFTHAEMAQLIAPRPFMVVAGYLDGVAAHEMVASEFEKVKRMYYMMGIPELAQIEFFRGGHDINGKGAFRFLHKHLDWPEPENPSDDQEITR